MKFFSKSELTGILAILTFLFFVSFPGFRESLMLARDLQRKNDLWDIYNGLSAYHEDFGVFPLSKDGKLLACKKPGTTPIQDDKGNFVVDYIACQWGMDALRDATDDVKPPYIKSIPTDPQVKGGMKYVYLSNGSIYQIFASLESVKQDEYDSKIEGRELSCGARLCNFGRGFPQTPLEKSIEEYENELRSKLKN